MPRSLFVVGSQRSGTTMLQNALHRPPAIEVHHEGSAAVMQDFRLISVERLREVLAASTAELVVLKPLCDSQWIEELLRHVDGSRAVWMYRTWFDVVNSATRKWPGHQLEVAERFRRGDERWLGWRAERIEPETRAVYEELLAQVSDDASAGAAFWWLRNRILFDRGLHQRDDFVRPLRYEALVADPGTWLARLCAFAGSAFDAEMAASIHSRSVKRDVAPAVPEPIRTACDALLSRLDQCAAAAWQS